MLIAISTSIMSICTARWILLARRLTSCCLRGGMQRQSDAGVSLLSLGVANASRYGNGQHDSQGTGPVVTKEQIGDPTMADSILDALVHNAHRVELNGESMRQKRSQKSGDGAAA